MNSFFQLHEKLGHTERKINVFKSFLCSLQSDTTHFLIKAKILIFRDSASLEVWVFEFTMVIIGHYKPLSFSMSNMECTVLRKIFYGLFLLYGINYQVLLLFTHFWYLFRGQWITILLLKTLGSYCDGFFLFFKIIFTSIFATYISWEWTPHTTVLSPSWVTIRFMVPKTLAQPLEVARRS